MKYITLFSFLTSLVAAQTLRRPTSSRSATSSVGTPLTGSTTGNVGPTTFSSVTVTSTGVHATQTVQLSGNYENDMLTVHNTHRANNSAAALVWDANLALYAQEVAQTCVYAHSTTPGGGGYGQNIMAGPPASAAPGAGGTLWYNNEVNNYPNDYGDNNPSMANFANWGHYSQMVWAASTSLGCYTQACGTLQNIGSGVQPYFTVCNFYPPGNVQGAYGNVRAPTGGNTIVFTPGG